MGHEAIVQELNLEKNLLRPGSQPDQSLWARRTGTLSFHLTPSRFQLIGICQRLGNGVTIHPLPLLHIPSLPVQRKTSLKQHKPPDIIVR